MSRNKILVISYLLWMAFAIIVIMLKISAARAHEWYPIECCSDRDCWVAGIGGAEPTPRAGPNGWVLHDGTVVPYNEARPSPDGRFHVCRQGGSTAAALIRANNRPCLWVPMGAS